jgi:hypothetical protein
VDGGAQPNGLLGGAGAEGGGGRARSGTARSLSMSVPRLKRRAKAVPQNPEESYVQWVQAHSEAAASAIAAAAASVDYGGGGGAAGNGAAADGAASAEAQPKSAPSAASRAAATAGADGDFYSDGDEGVEEDKVAECGFEVLLRAAVVEANPIEGPPNFQNDLYYIPTPPNEAPRSPLPPVVETENDDKPD